MPFFNKKEMVAQMIDSIVANDFHDWELLAVDDGSTPETIAFLEHFTTDERIHIIPRTEGPKGAQKCRNIGLDRARGKYIVFFDSDDYIQPYCLRNRVSKMEDCPKLDFMVFPTGTFDGKAFDTTGGYSFYGYPIGNDDLKLFARRLLPFIVCSNIYRTESLRKHNIRWDEALLSLQDADFNLLTITAGLRYEYAIRPADYGYRIANNSGSITSKLKSKEHYASHLHALTRYYDKIQAEFGHSYDHALYQGLLFIYNWMFAQGIDRDIAQELYKLVSSRSPLYGILFSLKLRLTYALEKVVSPANAVKIPQSFFFIRRVLTEKSRQKKALNYIKRHPNIQ